MCISFVIDSVFVQTLVFVASSIALLFFTKPLVTKITKQDAVVTNANQIIGKIGTVVKEVNSLEGTGQIKVGSEIWSAITTDTQNISKGTKIKVLEIDGVKAVVTSEINSTAKI
ncbi:MAG: NfeD family protein [Clostridia bacterium]|nr:NfeD family protein [Clostridia bacterium]